jgi:hypothetical protein
LNHVPPCNSQATIYFATGKKTALPSPQILPRCPQVQTALAFRIRALAPPTSIVFLSKAIRVLGAIVVVPVDHPSKAGRRECAAECLAAGTCKFCGMPAAAIYEIDLR